jgi:hypothetical protein
MHWKLFEGAMNAGILIGFMARLIKYAFRKISLIQRDMWVHHRKPVKVYLYAPNLNKL